MDRTRVMAVRLFAPALTALLATALLWLGGYELADQPMLRPLASDWAVLVDATFATALVLIGSCAVRLWRWTQGRTLDCPACGHLLGREREGRFGAYRRCLGCGKNIARINYA